MGYRHYVGYIEKSKYEEIVKEADKLEGYKKTSFMQDNCTSLLELGKLYYKNTEPIYNALYEHKSTDFSNDDSEFFVIDDDKILLHLSYAMQNIWANWVKPCQEILAKVIAGQEATKDEKATLLELSETLKREVEDFEDGEKACEKGWETPPYFTWQFNYEACRVYNMHKYFNYTDKVMVVFAY